MTGKTPLPPVKRADLFELLVFAVIALAALAFLDRETRQTDDAGHAVKGFAGDGLASGEMTARKDGRLSVVALSNLAGRPVSAVPSGSFGIPAARSARDASCSFPVGALPLRASCSFPVGALPLRASCSFPVGALPLRASCSCEVPNDQL